MSATQNFIGLIGLLIFLGMFVFAIAVAAMAAEDQGRWERDSRPRRSRPAPPPE